MSSDINTGNVLRAGEYGDWWLKSPPIDVRQEVMRQQAEKDPNGIPMKEPGAKADAGKVRMGLMLSGFPLALRAIAEITTGGAIKYTPGGWKHVAGGYERYYDAQARHQNKHDAGELIDPDFGCYHLAHEAWNSLAKLELFLQERTKIGAPIPPTPDDGRIRTVAVR